jgi:predicted YcjX-like family ATPase
MHTSASRLAGAQWRKSRYSGAQGNCVELAAVRAAGSARVAVRNSRFPDEPALLLTHSELGAFLAEVKAGGFDDLLEGS